MLALDSCAMAGDAQAMARVNRIIGVRNVVVVVRVVVVAMAIEAMVVDASEEMDGCGGCGA